MGKILSYCQSEVTFFKTIYGSVYWPCTQEPSFRRGKLGTTLAILWNLPQSKAAAQTPTSFESPTSFRDCFVLTFSKVKKKKALKEETDRTGSILKAGLHLGPDCGLWAICPVSMETTYQLEKQAPWVQEPQGSYLDSLLSKRIP